MADPGHDIIVVGASAGGVEALSTLVRGLPPDLEAAVFVVLHIPAEAPSMLHSILGRAGNLRTMQAKDGDTIKRGRLYVAPPDCHLLVQPDRIRVVRGPRENRHRPAIDPLFRSAAAAYGPRVIGVVLTGALDDGTAGLLAIERRGGLAVVQDPEDALYPSMPSSAIENVNVDYVVPVANMPALLVELVDQAPPADAEGVAAVDDDRARVEIGFDELQDVSPGALDRMGAPSHFTCPECHGTLWELQDGNLVRFRCRTGHAYTLDSLLADHKDSLEAALWAALRSLEESASLSHRMAQHARAHGHAYLQRRYERRATETERHAQVLRQLVANSNELDQEPATG